MEKFDVLAVLDTVTQGIRAMGVAHDFPVPSDAVREARAAVADLIEKAAEVRAAHRELPGRDHPAEVRQEGEARIGRAHYALDAALARIGGA